MKVTAPQVTLALIHLFLLQSRFKTVPVEMSLVQQLFESCMDNMRSDAAQRARIISK